MSRTTKPPPASPIDPDNPEWTADDFARAKGPEMLDPEILAAFPKTAARLRGRPRKDDKKVQISGRIEPDILTFYRNLGPGWQNRLNDVLRNAMMEVLRN